MFPRSLHDWVLLHLSDPKLNAAVSKRPVLKIQWGLDTLPRHAAFFSSLLLFLCLFALFLFISVSPFHHQYVDFMRETLIDLFTTVFPRT